MSKGIFSLVVYLIIAAIYLVLITSCAKGLTPTQAANGARCGQYLR